MPIYAEYYRMKRELRQDEATLPDDLAQLDRIDGEAYQAAVDKLTPAQIERYENADF